jgi:hypothetical protein
MQFSLAVGMQAYFVLFGIKIYEMHFQFQALCCIENRSL